jgi:NAD(P) transhydrogenase subunit alpha
MPSRVGVVKEVAPGETRVALVPSIVEKYTKLGVEVLMERGAGVAAFQPDKDYEEKGAVLVDSAKKLYEQCDVILGVQPPTAEAVSQMRAGTVLLGYMDPYGANAAQAMQDKKVTSFAVELIPRITRAQSMDVLTSQAAVAGYKAVLIAANELAGFLPMLTTPAGTIKPSKVLILGAGVAGLQAIATAKRLGAVVEAYDVRQATREQVQSLGAKFVALELEDAEASGGYARALTEEEKVKEREMLADHVAAADVVVSTAAIPGKPAPKLIFKDMVDRMKIGSVIVDLAAATGGNCELTKPGETYVTDNLVTIAAPFNVPALVPSDASEMYARNLLNFLTPHIKEGGELLLDWEDEVIKQSALTHDGELRQGGTK